MRQFFFYKQTNVDGTFISNSFSIIRTRHIFEFAILILININIRIISTSIQEIKIYFKSIIIFYVYEIHTYDIYMYLLEVL